MRQFLDPYSVLFTCEVLDEERVYVLLLSKQHPADDDKSVTKTGHHGNDPDGDAEEGDVEQVSNGRDAIADRLTDLDHRGVSTHVE